MSRRQATTRAAKRVAKITAASAAADVSEAELLEPVAEEAAPEVRWGPHAGPQTLVLALSGVFEILFGGARGGGKTAGGMAWLCRPPHFGHPRYRALVLRRNFDDLSDWIDRAAEFYGPLGGRVIASGPPRVVFESGPGKGAIFRLGHLSAKDTYTKYQGHEYQRLLVEEGQQIHAERQYELLLGSVRSTLEGLSPEVLLTANPGGIGHAWLKARFGCGKADGRRPNVAYRCADGRLRMYVPATVDDNPTLKRVNPEYVAWLEGLPEPFRSAWRYGDWDIYTGQAFAWGPENVIEPCVVPAGAKLLMTFDDGFGKPFSVGWWWVTGDRLLVRIGEWYGCVPGQADAGLRLADHEVAAGILAREAQMGIAGRVTTRLGDPTIFNRQPDKKGGGQGESTAATFERAGVSMRPGDPARKAKFMQFGARVKTRSLLVFRTCREFLRTVPDLPLDETCLDDVDTNSEDHAYDEACHACMEVPLPDRAVRGSVMGAAAAAAAAAAPDAAVEAGGGAASLMELLRTRAR